MTLYDLIPPVALATCINAVVLAALWRGSKIEARIGEPPTWLIVLILGYIAILVSYFYFWTRGSLQTGIDLMMASLAGEAMGVVAVFGVIRAVLFTRGLKRLEVVLAYASAIVVLGFLGWATIGLRLPA